MSSIPVSAHEAKENSPAALAFENSLRPVSHADRISSLDVVRGVALLGILLMNITAFGLPHNAYGDPTVAGGATGINLWYWFGNHVLFEGKMRAIFSMLFGAGVILLTTRGEAKNGAVSVADVYYRRLLWLILFGVINAYVLLWPGDILYPYALCGLFVFPLRKLSPRLLLLGGLLMVSILVVKTELQLRDFKEKKAAAMAADKAAGEGKELTEEQRGAQTAYIAMVSNMKPNPEKVEKEIKDMQKGYTSIFATLQPINGMIQSAKFYRWIFWDVMGMLLMGMALIKMGVFTPRRSKRFYTLMLVLGYGFGIPLGVYSGFEIIKSGFAIETSMAAAYTYDLRRFSVAFGHIGLIMLVYKSGALPWLMASLAAVGRMAFTNYLLQTIICTLIFYGYGFGLYGRLERAELLYVVLGIWVFQLAGSPIWLRYFHFGPLEWVWRSLTYWSPQPMRKVSAPAEPEVAVKA